MEYEWDEDKEIANRFKHPISFEEAVNFDWVHAIIIDRSRHADGEARYAAIGPLNEKLYALIFTRRIGRLRIISLRRANKSEEKAYAQIT